MSKIVYVTIYSHAYGETVDVFSTRNQANAQMDSIGRKYWESEFNTPMPAENVGKEYFAKMDELCREECFAIHPCVLDAKSIRSDE